MCQMVVLYEYTLLRVSRSPVRYSGPHDEPSIGLVRGRVPHARNQRIHRGKLFLINHRACENRTKLYLHGYLSHRTEWTTRSLTHKRDATKEYVRALWAARMALHMVTHQATELRLYEMCLGIVVKEQPDIFIVT